MENTEEALKVMRVKIKNFKNIKDLEIDLQGKSVFIIGENSQSKTSIIQAIWGCLSNKFPKQPIMAGEESSNILLVVGKDGKEYKIEKRFTEKTEKLLITSPEGFETEKVEKLKELIGDVDFDIVKFVNLVNTADGRRQQVKMIRQFLTPEVNAKFDSLNDSIKKIEADRTEMNSNIKRLKIEATANEYSESDIEKYKAEINVMDLMTKQSDAQNTNYSIRNAKDDLKRTEDLAIKLQKQLAELTVEKKKCEDKIKGMKTELENAVEVDIEPIRKQIAECGAHNKMVTEIKAHNIKVSQLEKANKLYKDLATQRDIVNADKAKLIEDSTMPVEGLTFTEDGLFYKGIPLDETQQSTSELMEIGFKIGIAKDTPCKVLRVDRAESLGSARLKTMIELAHQKGYQVFYEEVRRGAEKVQIEYVQES